MMKNDKRNLTSSSTNPSPDRHNHESDRSMKKDALDSPNAPGPMTATQEFIKSYSAAPFSPDFVQNVMDSVQASHALPESRHAVIYSLRSPVFLRYAAVFLILILAGLALWIKPSSHTAPLGYRTTHALADGSSVLLNSGSSISYKTFWGRSERRVFLQGEAFFDVRSSDKPFIVTTESAEIRVLGTRFSVRSWPDSTGSKTFVTLEEGKISVNAINDPQRLQEMRPNESLHVYEDSFDQAPTSLSPEETRVLLSWRDGGYAFQDALLSEVVRELHRRTTMQFTLAEDLQDVSVAYLNPNPVSAENVLEELSAAFSFSYSKNANGYQIFATPPAENQ